MQKLKEADKDQDGRLSKAEVAGMPLLSRHFDRIDADRDGRLTREELRGARDKMRRFRDEHFDTLRDMESESHQARIQILQQADACIKAAATTDAYRQCEQQEQAARQALRTSMQSKREGLTAQSRP
jgi:Ca2+-binding EF-hand superfamily protein